MRLTSLQAFDQRQKTCQNTFSREKKRILVCGGTGCVAGGSLEIFQRFQELISDKGEQAANLTLTEESDDSSCVGQKTSAITTKKSGCHGFCEMGPLVRIEPQGILYVKVRAADCDDIFTETIENDRPVERLIYAFEGKKHLTSEDIPFYKKQRREVLENCGLIDAESISEYIATGGYSALKKALFAMNGEDIINEITASKLRGRGGGGFPAGRKWNQVLGQKEPMRYVVCNGDEGDPGAFMDRSIMEGDPHKLIEGMLIAAVAVSAREGYIYVRAEYPLAIARLQQAIAQATAWGLLGDHILGSAFSFHLQINKGAGAFVCGEGSALTASIEGDRGMPRVKPPRTVEEGLFGKPTILNNVETFANVPKIILNGAEWFTSIGTKESPGTKAFALTGNVNNTGLIEVPMGTNLKEIIFEIGGGIKDGKAFKAVQIGGPSGGCLCLDKEHLELPLDFDSLKSAGAMIGSGGLVVMDEDTCMVEVARFFMNFTRKESCGKCVPCREGTSRMLSILEGIVSGRGKMSDLDLLEELAETITDTALCGLGKTAALPVVSTLKYFRNEYVAHIAEKKCPTKTCTALSTISIDPDLCKGCSKCARICPVSAIQGKIKAPYIILQDICIKCKACLDSCAFQAIKEE